MAVASALQEKDGVVVRLCNNGVIWCSAEDTALRSMLGICVILQSATDRRCIVRSEAGHFVTPGRRRIYDMALARFVESSRCHALHAYRLSCLWEGHGLHCSWSSGTL